MKNEEQLRKALRKALIEAIGRLDEDDIDEISASGGAGAYSTPKAFGAGREEDRAKAISNYNNSGMTKVNRPKKLAEKADQPLTKQVIDRSTQWGMELAPKTKNNTNKTDEAKDDHQDAEEAHKCQDTGAEGKGYLKKDKKDEANLPEHSVTKNIALALHEINRQLEVIRTNLAESKQLKESLGLAETPLWKRTQTQLLRAEAHLINVARIIKELK